MPQEDFKRKFTSLGSAEAVGSSRLMGEDVPASVRTLTSYRNIISTSIKTKNGIVVDSSLKQLTAGFVSAVYAVQCDVAVQ